MGKKAHLQLYKILILMSVIITLKIVLLSELRGKDILTIQPPETRFFLDHGNITYLCGKCKVVLAEDVGKLEKSDKVMKCNKCGSYNAV